MSPKCFRIFMPGVVDGRAEAFASARLFLASLTHPLTRTKFTLRFWIGSCFNSPSSKHRRQDREVLVRQPREHRHEDRGREADVLRQQAHHLLPTELLSTIVSQISFSGRPFEVRCHSHRTAQGDEGERGRQKLRLAVGGKEASQEFFNPRSSSEMAEPHSSALGTLRQQPCGLTNHPLALVRASRPRREGGIEPPQPGL